MTIHHPGLRVLDGRAAAGARLGRLRSEQSEEPAAADLAAGRARRAQGATRVLVDTSPDLREQLLDADVEWLDGVLMTHEHADHCHGIDDLRALFVHKRRRLDMYIDEADRGESFARASATALRPRPAANIRRSSPSTAWRRAAR